MLSAGADAHPTTFEPWAFPPRVDEEDEEDENPWLSWFAAR